jgi:hypothetical protein
MKTAGAQLWFLLGITRIYHRLYAEAQKKLNFTDDKMYKNIFLSIAPSNPKRTLLNLTVPRFPPLLFFISMFLR